LIELPEAGGAFIKKAILVMRMAFFIQYRLLTYHSHFCLVRRRIPI